MFCNMFCNVLTITILLSKISVLYFYRFFAIIIINIDKTNLYK